MLKMAWYSTHVGFWMCQFQWHRFIGCTFRCLWVMGYMYPFSLELFIIGLLLAYFATLVKILHQKKIARKCSIFLHQLYFFLMERSRTFWGIKIKRKSNRKSYRKINSILTRKICSKWLDTTTHVGFWMCQFQWHRFIGCTFRCLWVMGYMYPFSLELVIIGLLLEYFATLLKILHQKKIARKCSILLQQLYFFLMGRSRTYWVVWSWKITKDLKSQISPCFYFFIVNIKRDCWDSPF